MASVNATAPQSRQAPDLQESPDFSLILGGPIFQLLRKAHLQGDATELLHRRVIASILITWVPLLLLSFLGIEKSGRISFFHDVEVHARFLVSLPVLIYAELLVHSRIQVSVRRFVQLRVVLPEQMDRFREAMNSALRIRNSLFIELALLAFVYAAGLLVWNDRVGLAENTWYALSGSRWRLTPAGYWYVFLSIPLFQFVLLRWYIRLFIWFRFLWQVNKLDLNLLPTHPDRCGGLGFLGRNAYAFGPILFAQGAILAGVVGGRVLYAGETLQSFKLLIGGFVLFFVVAILAPLLMFTPRLANVRRKGLADYGIFAQRYAEGFDRKWIQTPVPSEEMLGSGDIQSLADLAGSYDIVREMRVVPFTLKDASRLAIATAVPLSPLLLTMFSFEELVMRLIKLIF